MIGEFVGRLHKEGHTLSYDQRTDMEHAIEQCIYCLYSHPSKRGKLKNLEEHNTTQVGIEEILL